MSAKEIVDLLSARGQTLAVAESLTGGLLGARVCDVAGASKCFLGGVTAYQDEIKARLLSVSPDTLGRFSAVSAACAREMARGAQRALGSDYALSTTGYAGPTGERWGWCISAYTPESNAASSGCGCGAPGREFGK